MSHQIPRQAKVRIVNFAGQTIKLYSIGWMAYAFQRHPETVKLWEAQGFLPPPILKTGGKWRYYTANEILAYSQIFLASRVKSGVRIDKQAFAKAFFDSHRTIKNSFRDDPKAVIAQLKNEEALLTYAAKSLSDKHSAELE